MKKLFIVLLVIVLAVPVFALAERDPIVGNWYFYYDRAVTPEMAASFGDYDMMIGFYTFMENGTILLTENDILNGSGTPQFASAGKWEKNGDNYTYSILGIGSGNAIIKDEGLYFELDANGMKVYMMMRKLIPFNPYTDYKYGGL